MDAVPRHKCPARSQCLPSHVMASGIHCDLDAAVNHDPDRPDDMDKLNA
jgi:hypothetical protein